MRQILISTICIYPIIIKWNIVFVTEMLGQPGSKTRVHNVVAICKLCHAKVNQQSKLLADIDVTPPRLLEAWSRSHDISMFCIEKCKQLEMMVSCIRQLL